MTPQSRTEVAPPGPQGEAERDDLDRSGAHDRGATRDRGGPERHRSSRPGARDLAESHREVVMVVEVHDPDRRGQEIDPASMEVFGAAVVDVHEVVGEFGGRPVAVLGPRLVASFPLARVADCLDAAVIVQRRAAQVFGGPNQWRCTIGLATGDVLDAPSFAGLGVPLLGGVFDRALLLCSWGESGVVVADGSTVDPALAADATVSTGATGATAAVAAPDSGAEQGAPRSEDAVHATGTVDLTSSVAPPADPGRQVETGAAAEMPVPAGDDAATVVEVPATAPGPGLSTSPEPPASPPPPSREWSLGPSEVLAGQRSSDVECWQLVFDVDGDADPEVLRGYRRSRVRGPAGRGDAVARRGQRDAAGEKHASSLLEPERLRQLDQVTAPASGPRRAPTARRSWSQGRVCCWFGDRGRGVIASSTAQEFYVDRRFLVVSADLKPNATVFFVPRDPVARGRNPVAGAVLVEGARLEARIEHVDDRGFGFAELSDSNGTRQLLLLDLSSLAEEVGVGDWILVEVRRSQHGPFAVPV